MTQVRGCGDRWFPIAARMFIAGALLSLIVVAVGGIVQVRVLGAMSFACAMLGLGVCALGMKIVDPLQWRARIARFEWAIGMRDFPPYQRREPALARVEAAPDRTKVVLPATA